MSRFTDTLIIEHDRSASRALGTTYWRVMQPFDFIIPAREVNNEHVGYDSGAYVHVPRGYLTDLGTVPPALRSIVDSAGQQSQAYVLHDYLIEYLSITRNGKPEDITREYADILLREAMYDLGVNSVTVQLVYGAVKGYTHSRKDKSRASATRLNALKRKLESEWQRDYTGGFF